MKQGLKEACSIRSGPVREAENG